MKKIYTILVFILLFFTVHAQQIAPSSQYLINPYNLSSTYAGSLHSPALFIGYRNEHINFPGSAMTNFFSIDAPIAKNAFVGGSLTYDQIDIFKHIYTSLSYSYRVKFNEDHALFLSLNGGLYQNSMDFTGKNLDYILIDPVVADKMNQRGIGISSGAGILYKFRKLGFGIDVLNLFESKLNYKSEVTDETYNLRRTYQGHFIYPIDINENWQITPILIGQYTMNSPFQWEAATMVKFKKNYWLAASFDMGLEAGVSAGARINNNIILNYTYEFSNKALASYNNGSHQFGFGFLFGVNQPRREAAPEAVYEPETWAKSKSDAKTSKKIDSLQNTIIDLNKRLAEIESQQNKQYIEDIDKMNGEIQRLNTEIEKLMIEVSNQHEKDLEETKSTKTEPVVVDKTSKTEVKKEERKVVTEAPKAVITGDKGYYLVLDSYLKQEQAERGVQIWAERGYKASVVFKSESGWYHVYSEKFDNLNDALVSLKEYRNKNLEKVWILIYK